LNKGNDVIMSDKFYL